MKVARIRRSVPPRVSRWQDLPTRGSPRARHAPPRAARATPRHARAATGHATPRPRAATGHATRRHGPRHAPPRAANGPRHAPHAPPRAARAATRRHAPRQETPAASRHGSAKLTEFERAHQEEATRSRASGATQRVRGPSCRHQSLQSAPASTATSPRPSRPRWQARWAELGLYDTDLADTTKPKYYLLTMYPYTSGNIHIGHWYAKTPTDAMARFHRMQGENVFFPIGFDSFGLPAENAAIKNKINPASGR